MYKRQSLRVARTAAARTAVARTAAARTAVERTAAARTAVARTAAARTAAARTVAVRIVHRMQSATMGSSAMELRPVWPVNAKRATRCFAPTRMLAHSITATKRWAHAHSVRSRVRMETPAQWMGFATQCPDAPTTQWIAVTAMHAQSTAAMGKRENANTPMPFSP